MKQWIFCVLFSSWSISAVCQFGLSINQNINDFSSWDERASTALGSDINLFTNGQEIGLDYWLRLKNVRIELLPQLAYSRSRTDIQGDIYVDGYALDQAHLNFNTNFYFLDFKDDCDCPTFSKQGNFFTKGFFLQLSPGLAYSMEKMNYVPATAEAKSTTDLSYKIGVGLGLDIGLTDLFTITPIARINWYPSVNWENFDLIHFDAIIGGSTANETVIRQIQFGIRIGFRPDYSNNRRR